MPQLGIGYRRLFNALGCSFTKQEELRIEFPFGEKHLQVNVGIGPKPIFGLITMGEHAKYAVRGGQPVAIQPEVYQEINQSQYAGLFFTEIICFLLIEVPAELSEAFHRDDPSAQEKLFSLAQERENTFRLAADVTDGIIGLKFHRQLVIDLLNESMVVFDDKRHATRASGSSIEVLDPIQLHEQDTQQMSQILSTTGNEKDEILQINGIILQWLKRAWTERDKINKFLSLLIPIEMILRRYGGNKEKQQELRLQAKAIRKFIRTHGGEQKEQLIAFFNALAERQRPTLEERFETLAQEANLPNWESDVKAFRLFNKMRNDLIHRGNIADIQLHVAVDEKDQWDLEDIAERYVNHVIFKDTKIYPHRFRPNRGQAIEQNNSKQE